MIDIIAAIVIDYILGDPYSFPHPVKVMGNLINLEDEFIRNRITDERKLRLLGFLVAMFNIMISFLIGFTILKILSPIPIIMRIVKIYIMYTCLSAKSLDLEASKVYDALNGGLEKARYQLSFIVGRDTSNLDEESIIKATIETVAENTADGIIAPLFFIIILGAPGGLMYKMVNTMDSMLGYKNERYINFGKWPALIDDVFNYIPARITAFSMLLSSAFKYDVKNGARIMLRDRKNHDSPNAGYPESAVAGMLGIELGGPNIYHGVLVNKPTMGDSNNKINKKHINDTINIMYRTEILFIVAYVLVRTLL